MNIWTQDSLMLFVLFFVPGFISLKIYDLLIAKEQRDFSKSWFDAVGYSTINFVIFYVLITKIIEPAYKTDHPLRFFGCAVLITIIMPALWPCVVNFIISRKWIQKYVVGSVRRPWDTLFSRREPYYIIVHLKDGRTIAGKYGEESFASAFPIKEQLYLQETWQIDSVTKNWSRVEGTKGILILGDEILCLDLLEGCVDEYEQ